MSSNPALAVVAAAWVVAVVLGFALLWRYKSTPGAEERRPPSSWPVESRVEPARGRATLLMFAHPHCPCTRASLNELAELLPRVRNEVTSHVLVVRPPGVGAEWDDGALWSRAASIPGVTVDHDVDGREAALFRARTSGFTVVYDARGRRLFSGGITPSRGHEGDSFGRRRILALLTGGAADRDDSPVFGCALATHAPTPAHLSMKEETR